MIVCTTLEELREWRKGRASVGFVPTMGALHAGHAALIAQCASKCNETVVSIFVNPTQFAPHEDLSRYPRPLEKDLALSRANGATLVFTPTVETMYGNSTAAVRVDGPTEGFEGAIRPHHFQGVATVVAKLFNCVQPDDAFFGMKDLQQCAVIRNLIESLSYPVRFHACETVREADGLTLSSRNTYLSEEARALAPLIYSTLKHASIRLLNETTLDDSIIQDILESSKGLLLQNGFDVQYLAMVDPVSYKPTTEIQRAHLIIAAVIDGVRLIDNLRVQPAN